LIRNCRYLREERRYPTEESANRPGEERRHPRKEHHHQTKENRRPMAALSAELRD
jgi:hypothetical protein